MTKLVTFNRAMSPYAAGESRLVPDDVAERLDSEGVLSASKPFPEGAAAVPPPSRVSTHLPQRQKYATKRA
jgi:hypothetical protein